MSDVTDAALIAGGFTALTSIASAAIAYMAQRRQAATTLAAVRAQADVDVTRLRAQFQEDDRGRRREAYVAFLEHFDILSATAMGLSDATPAALDQWRRESTTLVNRLGILAPPPVFETVDALAAAIDEIVLGLSDKEPDEYPATLRTYWSEHEERLRSALNAFAFQARGDIALHD